MAESVEEQIKYLSRRRPDSPPEEVRTVPELRKSLGYIEGDPFTYLGDEDRRRKVEVFVLLAKAGALVVLPHSYDEEG